MKIAVVHIKQVSPLMFSFSNATCMYSELTINIQALLELINQMHRTLCRTLELPRQFLSKGYVGLDMVAFPAVSSGQGF